MKPVYPAPRALPSYENLLLEMVEPNILKVTLNRPKAYNALSHGLVEDLTNLSQWLVDEFKKAEGVDLSGDKMAMQRLKEAAEKAKKELSTATTTNINLPFITATAEGPKHLDMNLTRAKFDELTRDLVDRTAVPVQNALKDGGVTTAELGKVLLVGGSTRMLAVPNPGNDRHCSNVDYN